MLFWISCLPSMMMLSWMQSSMRQPPGAHWERRTLLLVNNSKCFTWSHKREEAQIPRGATHLFHPVIIEDIHVIPRSTSKPARKKKKKKDTQSMLIFLPVDGSRWCAGLTVPWRTPRKKWAHRRLWTSARRLSGWGAPRSWFQFWESL